MKLEKVLTKAYKKLLTLTAPKEFIPYRCVLFDGSPEDGRRLATLASFAVAGDWKLYGDARFITELVKFEPGLLHEVITRKNLQIVVKSELPRRIFICALKCEELYRISTELRQLDATIETAMVDVLSTLVPEQVPVEAYAVRASRIYPICIPEFEVPVDLDFLLLGLPASYSFFNVGLGYVHEILKRCGIRHCTFDFNMTLYHRYHMHMAMDFPGPQLTAAGYRLADDPWGAMSIDDWSRSDVIEYFRSEIETILVEIERSRPKMIGLSLHMGNRLFAAEVVKGIRQRSPETVVVVGGFDCVHVEFGPKIFTDFDYMVIGEAECSLPELVQRIAAGERPVDLPGIVSRFDTAGRIWQPAPLEQNLDSLSFPRYDWTDISLFRSRGGYFGGALAINRGCKWSRCTFCCECFPWRKRSAANVVDEIEWLAGIGCREFGFSVSDAIGDSVTLLEIAKEINRRTIRINVAATATRAGGFLEFLKDIYLGNRININTQLRVDKRSDVEFFKALRRAGFRNLAFGVDGWTDRQLRMQVKGYNFALVAKNLKAAVEAGISCSVNIVLGIPGETEEDVDECIRNIISLKEYITSFNSIYPLILSPGSKYYQEPDAYDIRFRGDKDEIYDNNPYRIPTELWYSENPYIDQPIRMARVARLCRELGAAGIKIDDHVLYMVDKFVQESKADQVPVDAGSEH
jgi:radical SAM superfamily enzyme YgiQ (UPF0313 family)